MTEASPQIDPNFFVALNEYIALANKQGKSNSSGRISLVTLYAAGRFNAHHYLLSEKAPDEKRGEFLDYMVDLYRRILEENLDNLAVERGIKVTPDAVSSSVMAGEAGATE